jgi:calcineurin-like phosphoesterase family protein
MVRGITEWKDPDHILDMTCRPYNTLEEMNDAIVDSINNLVGENDVLFHLGDFCIANTSKVIEFRNRINCKNIHLIYGNHDDAIYSSTNLRELFTSTNHYAEIKYNNELFTLMHYPIDDWKNMNHGSYMVHGHQHNKTEVITASRRIDVGFDGHSKPVSLRYIHETLSKNPIVRNHKYPRLFSGA